MSEAMTLLFDSNRLYTPPASFSAVLVTPLSATSRVFTSYVPVEAVQFASWQTQAISISPDENFKSPDLPTSAFSDLANWHYVGDARVFFTRSGVTVTRNPEIIQTMIGTNNPLIHPTVTPVLTTSPVFVLGTSPSAFGGIESALVPVSVGGAISAAVRVTVARQMTSPLYLQVVGSDSTTVLSEQVFTPTIGTKTEQTLVYPLGRFTSLEGSLRVRVIQKGGSTDSWIVDSLALFDESILWEWSNDSGTTWVPAFGIRNNANGVLRFSLPGCGLRYRVTAFRNNLSITMIKIKPWYFGRVLGRHSQPQRGANLSVFDDDIPIQEDPDFTAWTNPTPQPWFIRYKSYTMESAKQYGDALFARSYSRTTTSTAGVVDAAIRTVVLNRGSINSVAVSDSATAIVSYLRGGSDGVRISDSSRRTTWESMARPPVDPPV
jgi:hypothetical protein